MKTTFAKMQGREDRRNASVSTLIEGVSLLCIIILYIVSLACIGKDSNGTVWGKVLVITCSYIAAIYALNHLLILSRRFNSQKREKEIADTEMLRILQEEGFSPHSEDNGDMTFNVSGKVFAFGKCTEGFVYARLCYEMNPDDKWNAMQAAQYTEASYKGIKVLLVPHKKLIMFSVESLCIDSESFRLFIKLAMKILSESVNRFYERMNALSVENQSKRGITDSIELFNRCCSKKTLLS